MLDPFHNEKTGMDFQPGAIPQAAAASMIELGQKALTQHLNFVRQGAELSQKFFAKSLKVKSGEGWVGFALDYFASVHNLASEMVGVQVTLAGEVTRVARQSLIQPEALPAPAAITEKVVTGGSIAGTQEHSPEKKGVPNALREITVASARAVAPDQP